jgi:hypothetical protein
VAQRIEDALDWGLGAIQPSPVFTNAEDQRTLVEAVLDCLEPVSKKEQPYTACTDGRCPVRLLNDEPVPVREQMVGADIVSAFYAAEILGERFYKDAQAPVIDRLKEVVAFLQENGYIPSTHVGCGAAAGFATIAANIAIFATKDSFPARVRALLPESAYDSALFNELLATNQKNLDCDAYGKLSADDFLQTIESASGKRAIAELKDDGRGVHGHVEEAIIRIRVPGYAINETKLTTLTNGREVFGVNDDRMEQLARIFGRGQDADYKLAYMALESFASAGHATLAKDLPTYIVTSL